MEQCVNVDGASDRGSGTLKQRCTQAEKQRVVKIHENIPWQILKFMQKQWHCGSLFLAPAPGSRSIGQAAAASKFSFLDSTED